MPTFKIPEVMQVATDYILAPQAEVKALQDHLAQYDDPQQVLFDALGISRRENIDVEQLAIALKEAQTDDDHASCIGSWLISQSARFGHEIDIP